MRFFYFTITLLVSLSLLGGASFVNSASAITVALPDLTGDYELDPSVLPNSEAPGFRSVDFVLPANITAIDQMTLVLSGQWHQGQIGCNSGFEDPDYSDLLPPLALFITSDAFPGDFFVAIIQMPDGPFENLTADFSSCCPNNTIDLNDLIGAQLHAELAIDVMLVGMCWLTEDTFGSLINVELELTGTVPASGSTMSGIKSLYR